MVLIPCDSFVFQTIVRHPGGKIQSRSIDLILMLFANIAIINTTAEIDNRLSHHKDIRIRTVRKCHKTMYITNCFHTP